MSATASFKGRQVVLLASIDWGAAWQRHQAWAKAFAEQGAEVFFIENTGFRDLRAADLARVGRRLERLWRPRRAPRPPHGIRVVSPFVLPPTRPLFRLLNAVYFIPWLRRRLRRRGLRTDAVAFAYLPTETTLQLLDALRPARVVYDCVDNFAGHPTPPGDLGETEASLLARADAVLTTSRFLYEQKAAHHPRVMLVHHGVSEAFLRAPRLAGPVRRLCYFGTIWSAVDFSAVRALAEAGFEVTLAGPVKEPPPPLPPSVALRGALRHDDLPRFLDGFDALLLPYADTEYNKGVVPAKLYECLATGKPVLASALPSLREHADLLYLAEGPDDFPRQARRAAREDDAGASARRIAAARAAATPAQAARVCAFVDGTTPAAPPSRPSPLPASGETFVRGISWIALLFAAARLATLAVQFIGARALGPAAYGTAHLVAAVSALIQIPDMLGFPLALSHFTAAARDDRERGKLVTTGLVVFGAWAACCAVACVVASSRLAALVELPPRAWALTAALALATAVHYGFSSSLQGLGRFRERGAVEALYGGLALLILMAGLALGLRSYETLIGSYIGGLGAAAAASIVLLSRRLRGSFEPALLPKLLPYAALGTVNVLGAALVQAPGRIVMYHSFSAVATGLYSAYFAATVQVALALSNMLQTVLVPLASQPEGSRGAWRALRQGVPGTLAGGWAAFCVVAVAALALLGRDYPLHAGWVVLFSGAAGLVLVHGAAMAFFSARGLGGLAVAAVGALLAGLGNLGFNLVLTPRYGMTGAAAALCLGYGLGTLWYVRRLDAWEAA